MDYTPEAVEELIAMIVKHVSEDFGEPIDDVIMCVNQALNEIAKVHLNRYLSNKGCHLTVVGGLDA